MGASAAGSREMMGVGIGRRLPATDTEMLAVERHGPNVSGACPWLWVMDGPCPSPEDLARHLSTFLPRKMRQRVKASPWRITRPCWVDVPSWSIDDHIQLVDDRRYWSEQGWMDFISKRLTIRLDRSESPWRMWLIPHRDDSCFAIVSMLHHALADGHSGLQLLMLSAGTAKPGSDGELACNGTTKDLGVRSARRAVAEPVALAMRDVADLTGVIRSAVRALVDTLRSPGEYWSSLREACSALIALAMNLRREAAEIPGLNVPLSGRQQVCRLDISASETRLIMEWLNCFPNDLFLSLVGAGVGCLLGGRGIATQGLDIHVWVPVNTGDRHARMTLGNHVAGVRVPVPVGQMPADERLGRVRAASRQVSAGRLVLAAKLITKLENVLPAPLLPWAASIALSPNTMNIIASHMVVPSALEPFPKRRLRDVRAWTFLPERHTMSFAGQSLNSQLSVNYIVDPVSIPDYELLARGMRDHAHDLVEIARYRQESAGDGQ